MTIHALLVDDDPDTRAITALALDLHPRFAATAVSRTEAADLLRRGTARFDAILLDMKAGDASAGALVATMRRGSRVTAPVVLLAAGTNGPCRVAGAQGLIAKPFDPLSLPDRVAGLLEPVAAAAPARYAH